MKFQKENELKKTIKVLTLNCWGIPDFLTKFVYKELWKDGRLVHRSERMKRIGENLSEYDVVCFQEIWLRKDADTLRLIGKEKEFEYSHWYNSGSLASSGLLLLSKFPIVETFFHRYRVNGRAIRLDHGDYHAGKGIAFAKLRFPNAERKGGEFVNVFFTHTIAKYQFQDSYLPDRLTQIWELAKFVQLTSSNFNSGLVLVCGDLNCQEDSSEYQLLCRLDNLVDSFRSIHPSQFGATIVKDVLVDSSPKRLDYIFFKPTQNWKLKDSKLAFKHDSGTFFSDHLGVTSTFEFVGNEDSKLLAVNNVTPLAVNNVIPNSTTLETEEKISQLIQDIAKEIQGGIKDAKVRRRSHFSRVCLFVLVFYFLGFISHSIPLLSMWYILLGFYVATELFIAVFMIHDEIGALHQIRKEMMMTTTISSN